MDFPIKNEDLTNYRVLASTSLRKIREAHPNLEDVVWEACDLPQYLAAGVEPSSGVIKIRNGHPAWKSMFKAQRGEVHPFSYDTLIHGMDGIVPVHHVFLLYKSKFLTKIIMGQIKAQEPPSDSNPINIFLSGFKLGSIRLLLSMFYCGQTKAGLGEEAEIRSLMKSLKIRNRKFQLFPFTPEEIPNEKFLRPLIWRWQRGVNQKPHTSTSVQLVQVAASSGILVLDIIPEVRNGIIPKSDRKSEVDESKGSTVNLEQKIAQGMAQGVVDMAKVKEKVNSQAAPCYKRQRSEEDSSKKQRAKMLSPAPNPGPTSSQTLPAIGNNDQKQEFCPFQPRLLPPSLYHPRRVASAGQTSTVKSTQSNEVPSQNQ